jgi:iron complex transport system substrate-binding protein
MAGVTLRIERVLTIIALLVALSVARVPLSAVQASLETDVASRRAQIRVEGERTVLEDATLSERVGLPRVPRRIVSLTLASDELLASLVPVERVIGVTPLVDDPSYSHAAGVYPATTPRVSASAEALLALSPDLVVVSSYSHPATARALVGAGVPVLRLPSGRSLDEVREAVVLLSRAVGAEERAAPMLARFDATRASLSSQAPTEPRPRALFLAAGGFTHGRGTLTDELLALGGVDNVARERGLDGLSRIGAEVIVASQPDLVIVPAADEGAARAALESMVPGAREALRGVRVLALPPSDIEATTPPCVEASRRLREAL